MTQIRLGRLWFGFLRRLLADSRRSDDPIVARNSLYRDDAFRVGHRAAHIFRLRSVEILSRRIRHGDFGGCYMRLWT
jgi:hypothetical protein